jgi:hypothetical protein
MDNERPANFSLEDGYLRVAGACGRAEYLERLAHYHALGKLRVSGLPNGTGERRDIPLLGLIDYRLAFGTDGRGTLAVHKNLAAKWLPGDGLTISKTRASKWPLFAPRNPSSDWRTPPPRSTPAPEPGRRLLAEGDTEIDQRAYRAIMRACARAKPGAAPAAFTDLQLSGKEFIKLFHKGAGKAPADARALTASAAREILRKAIAEKNRNEAGKAFSQRLAVTHVQSIDPQFDREEVRKIMRELTDNRPRGRPKLIGGK